MGLGFGVWVQGLGIRVPCKGVVGDISGLGREHPV